MSSPSTNIHLW